MVIAAPVYNHGARVEAALRSLLGQTFRDFALVVVENCSSDDTPAILERLAREDARVHVHSNPRHVGMRENTNRAYSLARELFPDAELWALASDHDVWDREWLATLVAALDANPGAVLAYPHTTRIDGRGAELPGGGWSFDTRGSRSPARRVFRCAVAMPAGDMMYGLFRRSALDATGLYRPVLMPDRLLLLELAQYGEFVQVPGSLWLRRYEGHEPTDRRGVLRRQRQRLFLGRAPRGTMLPVWMAHLGAFARRYGLRPATLGLAGGMAVFESREAVLRARNRVVVALLRALGARPRER